MKRSWWLRYALALGLLLTAHLAYAGFFTSLPVAAPPADWQPEAVRAYVDAAWDGSRGSRGDDPLLRAPGLCWVTGYRGGFATTSAVSLWEARATALPRLLNPAGLREMEAVEVGLATQTDFYNQEVLPREETWGLLLRCSAGDLLLTPGELARRGEFPDGQAKKYALERTIWRQAKFRAVVFTLRRDQGFRAREIVRGDAVLPALDEERSGQAARAAAGYLQGDLRRHDGLLSFAVTLATGQPVEEGKKLSALCLGSLSLARYASWTGDPQDRALSERHLRTMIARYGHHFEDRCALSDGPAGELGAQALFAMALAAQPQADAFLRQFQEGLARTLRVQRRADGHFATTFSLPGGPQTRGGDVTQDEGEDREPALALAYLASHPTLAESELSESLEYYRKRFLHHPHKATVPWLTVAYQARHERTGASADADVALQLADWNLSNLVAWDKMEPQLRGGLINPDIKQYGASCLTAEVGLHLRGLAAARAVALARHDEARLRRYQTAMLEMSRFLAQMQVRSERDLYWLPPDLRKSPPGALREACWSGTLPVEACASALLGWTEWFRQKG